MTLEVCIRDEAATRAAAWPDYPPHSLPNTRCISLCGEHVANNWIGAEHAVVGRLPAQISAKICRKCADKAIVAIGKRAGIDKDIDKATARADPGTPPGDLVDRILFAVFNTLDLSEAWGAARREPEVFREAVQRTIARHQLVFSLFELTVIATAVDEHREKIVRLLGPSVPASVPLHEAIVEKIRAHCSDNKVH